MRQGKDERRDRVRKDVENYVVEAMAKEMCQRIREKWGKGYGKVIKQWMWDGMREDKQSDGVRDE